VALPAKGPAVAARKERERCEGGERKRSEQHTSAFYRVLLTAIYYYYCVNNTNNLIQNLLVNFKLFGAACLGKKSL
jgi:hypothetical protein